MSLIQPTDPFSRQSFRSCTRRVLRDPANVAHHRERLNFALKQSGNDAVQGTLADLFFGCRVAETHHKREALNAARNRLSPAVQQGFEPYINTAFPSCTSLATRWSVLVTPSLNVSQRAVRRHTHDAVELAALAVTAWRQNDEATQTEFLEHCLVCRDNKAFMLARKAILQKQAYLPPRWESISTLLQQAISPS